MAKQTEQEPVLNTEGTHVWLYNPTTDGTWLCPVDAAKLFIEHRGWEYTVPPDYSMEGLFDVVTAEGEQQTGFDPNEHKVDEINTYLEANLGSPGEIERVLALEASGQARATVKDPRPDSTTDK